MGDGRVDDGVMGVGEAGVSRSVAYQSLSMDSRHIAYVFRGD